MRHAFGLHIMLLCVIVDGLPIVLTSNIDGYIPLKFESGGTYHMSCQAASPGNSLISSNVRHQSDMSCSPESRYHAARSLPSSQQSHQQQQQQHRTTAESLKYDHRSSNSVVSTGSEAAAAVSGTDVDIDSQAAAAQRTAKLKSLIISDKSGNAMRRLQAAAAGMNSNPASAAAAVSTYNQSNGALLELSAGASVMGHSASDNHVGSAAAEPRKPPRRGNHKKNNRSDDSADQANSFMDVTAAI